MRIHARADDDVPHVLRDGQHLNFARGFRLVIDAVGRTEEQSLHAQVTFEQQFREVQLNLQFRFGDGFEIRMGVSVIPDFVALLEGAPHQSGILVGLFADHEESRGGLFLLQNIENFGSPPRVRAVIETERDFMGSCAESDRCAR